MKAYSIPLKKKNIASKKPLQKTCSIKIWFYICTRNRKLHDLVAQLVEHLPFKERVLGSSPSPVTKAFPNRKAFFIYCSLIICTHGGIGRRAGLRGSCPKGRGSSSLLVCTTTIYFILQSI